MRHYLFVGESREVLGVWEAEDEVSATRLSLQLSLMYPGCKTVEETAEDFETFKQEHAEYNFDGLEPDRAEDILGIARGARGGVAR
jgi:hypothetical protein